MPETELSLTAGVRSRTYGEIDSKWPRRIATRLSGLTLVATTVLTDTVVAQTSTGDAALLPAPTGPFANSFEVMNFALVIGAVSAAMISAIWLIRERGKISLDNAQLRTALSDANTDLARYQALIVERDRAYVIWDGQSAAQFLGSLPPNIGAPRASRDLLAFGRWLEPASAASIERAIDALRTHASSFDMEIQTQRGHLLEAQGRISGGRAFVRLAALANVRAELASLKAERDRLFGTVETQRTLLDAIEMPAWLRNSDGKLSWVNQAYAHAVEATDGNEAVDRGLEVLGTQVRERVRAERMLERPFYDRISTVVRGNRTFYEVTDAVCTHGSGGLAQDVTEAEAIREELKRTVDSHSETLDHLATPVAIFDGEQKLQFYNQAFQTLWELDTPFLEAKPSNGELLERLRAEGRLPEPGAWRDWKEEVLSVYQSVDPQPDLWHLPDGQTLNVFANVHPLGGVTWVFENLTEKYDLETRLNTLLKVQGETIDYLAEGVCVFGADGKLRLSNPAFRALWAIPEKDAEAGAHINEIADVCKPSYDAGDGWPHFSSVITGYDEERQTHEGRLELHSGLVLDYAIVPLPNAQMMLTFVNVTDSAKVEKALTDKNEALRKADALKNDFVQHVSYELRSPLTNIIGFTDLLKTPQIGDLNKQQAEYVDHISTSSALLLTIVNDILDLATVDAGIMQLDMTRIELPSLIDEVVGLIDARFKENAIELDIQISKDAEVMTADAQRLKQILFKLLSNAANYAPEGSVVRLSCQRERDEIAFSVSDNGPGIPSDILKTVFDRFETHNGTGRRSGAGLGLSIVDSFVSLHNGTVTVSSDEGNGTKVVCRLPSTPPLPSQAAE